LSIQSYAWPSFGFDVAAGRIKCRAGRIQCWIISVSEKGVMKKMNNLHADPSRSSHASSTGFYIRAKRGERWDSVDIAELDSASLRHLLFTKGLAWSVAVLEKLLDHRPK
jgi:hypothetical protein